MDLYASKMIDMLNRSGQPVKTTSTVTQPNQGLDIGSLIAMLAMTNLFGGGANKPSASDPSNFMNAAEILGPMGAEGGFGGTMTATPQPVGGYNNMTPGGDITPDLLLRLLSGFRGR